MAAVAGDLFRFDDGVDERGELLVTPGGFAVMSPLELPRIRFDALGVVAGVDAVAADNVLAEGVVLDEADDELLALPPLCGVVAFLLLLLLLSDFPFLVLLFVKFSAIRSLRTHSSYLVFHPV